MSKLMNRIFATRKRVKQISKSVADIQAAQIDLQNTINMHFESSEEQGLLNKIEQKNSRHITSYYNKNNNCKLTKLFDQYGSDKGEIVKENKPYWWDAHTYSDFYATLFDHCRNSVKYVFECGLGTNDSSYLSNMTETGIPGASLRAWRDYFPNAEIFGADIDRNVLFEEERIKTYYVDQTSKASIKNMWEEINIDEFDFILDDGLHTFEAGISLFENSIENLSDSGLYIIEDISLVDLLKFMDYFSNHSKYNASYITLMRPYLQQHGDNNLLMIKKTNS